jgi:hypothetical protein
LPSYAGSRGPWSKYHPPAATNKTKAASNHLFCLNVTLGNLTGQDRQSHAPFGLASFPRDFALAQQMGVQQILFWEADYIDDRAQAAELKAAMSLHARW